MHGLEAAPEAKAAPQGVVLRVSGACTIKSDGAKDVSAQKDSPVRIGDRVSCKPGASIRLRLPGSGADHKFKSDKTLVEYLVPAAQSAPALDSTNRGGRDASNSLKMSVPEPRHATMQGMGVLPPANAGSARGTEEALAEAMRRQTVIAALTSTEIRKCEVPVGTLAIVEATERSSPEALKHAGLRLTTPTLQAAARSSNCFVVVPSDSIAMNKMLAERALAGAAGASAGARAFLGQSDYVLVSRSIAISRQVLPGLLGSTERATETPTSMITELRLVDSMTGAAIGSGQVKVAERRVPTAGGQDARASAVTAEEQARVVSETAKSFNAFVDAARVSKGVGAQPAAAAAAAAMPETPASGPR